MTTMSSDFADGLESPAAWNSSWYATVKPILDRCFALILGVLVFPCALVAMLAVKLTSPGPAIYSQKRLGRNGRVFTIYKIRTMRNNCEKETGAKWADPNDSRVTPVGKFLRATHIDEFPQLWNVLKGEMGLVGPRPERPEIAAELEREVPEFRQRLAGAPGITGLAQVQLPADLEINGVRDLGRVRRKLACDVCYNQNASLWLDVRILLATAAKVLGISRELTSQYLRLPRPWVEDVARAEKAPSDWGRERFAEPEFRLAAGDSRF